MGAGRRGSRRGAEALGGLKSRDGCRGGRGRSWGWGILGKGEARQSRAAAVRGRGEEGCEQAQLPDPGPKTPPGVAPYPCRFGGHCSGPSAASQPGTSRARAPGGSDSLPAPAGRARATPPLRREGERRGGAGPPACGPLSAPTLPLLPRDQNPAVPSDLHTEQHARLASGPCGG